ncbi:uncharacterized protein LOC117525960 [Scomber scombrus]|uniref:Uncharacterized protein LOC117525960 n=1 Tax=Scomber scombrus TaxID=13677 RepID=A0AAV1PKW3_SCOSC
MTVLCRQRGDFESFYAKFEEKCQLLGMTDPFTRNVQPIKEHRRELFHNIYEDVSSQMKNRSDHYGQLSFFSLVDLRRFDKMSSSFDDRSLKSLEEAYAKHFDFIRLKADLTGLYSSQLICEFLHTNDLVVTVPEATKLLSLILTLPATTASVERSFSALKRIKTYSRNRTGEERLSSLAVISIEAEHLVDADFLVKSLSPVFSEMGTMRHQRESTVINFLQDFVQDMKDEAEDENNREDMPEETMGEDENVDEAEKLKNYMNIHVGKFCQWLTGQSHIPLSHA